MDITFIGMEEFEKFREKLANKDNLSRDLFIWKITDSDKSVQQYTDILTKAVLDGLFGNLLFVLVSVEFF